MKEESVERPWGYYEVLDKGEGWQLKKLVIHPGEATSLQYHKHREEHWMFVEGSGRVDGKDGSHANVGQGAVHTVPKGVVHRIVNNSDTDLVIFELQRGDIISEDDIVRIEDKYGRA